MSYKNPDILLLANPIGIDAVIQSIQQDFYLNLPWLTKSFGRAREFSELDAEGRTQRIPKCFMGVDSTGTGEYMNVLPNDFLNAQSFILARSEEKWPSFTDASINGKERDLSVIFWLNLKQVNGAKDYIFTEELRFEVEKILKNNVYVKAITAYYDERAEDVFAGYIKQTEGGFYSGIDDARTQYLMYPYAGFRFDVTAAYPEHTDCLPWNNFVPTGIPLTGDIDFIIGDPGAPAIGDTTYVDSRLVGKKIRFFRGGLKQITTAGSGYYYSFSSETGTLTVNPAWSSEEKNSIEIYGFNDAP